MDKNDWLKGANAQAIKTQLNPEVQKRYFTQGDSNKENTNIPITPTLKESTPSLTASSASMTSNSSSSVASMISSLNKTNEQTTHSSSTVIHLVKPTPQPATPQVKFAEPTPVIEKIADEPKSIESTPTATPVLRANFNKQNTNGSNGHTNGSHANGSENGNSNGLSTPSVADRKSRVKSGKFFFHPYF